MFKEDEQRFQQLLKESDAPFLGVLGENLEPSCVHKIVESIRLRPSVDNFTTKLRQFPAFLGSYLSHEISSRFASSGRYEVYPAIRDVLQLERDLTVHEKELLWEDFKFALSRLGLPVSTKTSGSHYMADTYTQQLGVPAKFLEAIAAKMLSFAKKAGLPNLEDDSAVRLWQCGLAGYLEKQPISLVAKRAISLDEDAYYSRVFVSVNRNLTLPGFCPSNLFEQAVSKVLTSESQVGRHYAKARIPTLIFKEGQLGLRVPGSNNERFNVSVDGADFELDYSAEDWFYPLPNVLAKNLVISNTTSNLVFEVALWPAGRGNEILVFDEAGYLVCSGYLGQDSPIQLRPGAYTVVSRFSPADQQSIQIWDEPSIFEVDLFLSSGGNQEFRNGPARLLVCATTEPTSRIEGQQKVSLDGSVLRYGGQCLEIEVPVSWEEQFGLTYSLRLKSSQHDDVIAVDIFMAQGQSNTKVDIGDLINQSSWTHALHQVSIELARFGEKRAVHRKSILYWKGLISISNSLSFGLSELPRNLKSVECKNARIANNLIELESENARIFGLAFDIGYKHTKTLQWNRSGIFIEVEQQLESGASIVLRKSLGDSETASVSLRKDILVYSDVPGTFTCGDWREYCSFDKRPVKRVGLGFLASRIVDSNNQLKFTPEHTSLPIVLLSVVKPHHADAVSVTVSESLLTFSLILPNEPKSILLDGTDLLTGLKSTITFSSNSNDWETQANCRARGFCEKRSEGYKLTGVVDLSDFLNGAWKFDLFANIKGLLAKLQNAREDNFAISVFWSSAIGLVNPRMIKEFTQNATDSEIKEVLVRAQRHLRPCYSPDSWVEVSWLEGLWRDCLHRLKSSPAEAIHAIADVSCELPDTTASLGWTLQHFAGAVCPEVYCQQAKVYRAAPSKKHPVARAFGILARLHQDFHLIGREFLHLSVAMSFSNSPALSRASEELRVHPLKFSLSSYVQLMKHLPDSAIGSEMLEHSSSILSIEDSDILSPRHWNFAKSQLAKKYDLGLSGNQVRRGQSLLLCRQVKQHMFAIPSNSKFDVAGKNPIIQITEISSDSDTDQRQENLILLEHFISLFAFHCRLEPRQTDATESFFAPLKRLNFNSEPALGYILQLGDELLATYLIFWEVYFRSQASVTIDASGVRTFTKQKTA